MHSLMVTPWPMDCLLGGHWWRKPIDLTMCLIVFHFFWFPTFRSLLPSANEQLWPRIPDVSSHQEQHWWPDNQHPGEEQHHQQRPSPCSTGQGSRRWLARTSGLWQRKWDVRGVKTVDQGSSSYHGGPYCLYSSYVRWRKHQCNGKFCYLWSVVHCYYRFLNRQHQFADHQESRQWPCPALSTSLWAALLDWDAKRSTCPMSRWDPFSFPVNAFITISKHQSIHRSTHNLANRFNLFYTKKSKLTWGICRPQW